VWRDILLGIDLFGRDAWVLLVMVARFSASLFLETSRLREPSIDGMFSCWPLEIPSLRVV